MSASVAVLACVVLASPVFAFVSRRTHVAVIPATIGSPSFGSSTAICPTGQHVLFGGFDDPRGLATGMRRTADDRWTVDGWNEGIGAGRPVPPPIVPPLRLPSFVYCGNGPVPAKVTSTVEIRYPHGRRGQASATARCPAGTVVVAGGFVASPRFSIVNGHVEVTEATVTDLERVAADLWRVSAFLAGGTHAALTSIAYCGPGPAPKLVSQTVTSFHHAGYLGLARATCPAGTNLVFGGAVINPAADGSLQTLRVPAHTKNSWAVTGNGVVGREKKLTALAYCR